MKKTEGRKSRVDNEKSKVDCLRNVEKINDFLSKKYYDRFKNLFYVSYTLYHDFLSASCSGRVCLEYLLLHGMKYRYMKIRTGHAVLITLTKPNL
jgi:hypothetical protein